MDPLSTLAAGATSTIKILELSFKLKAVGDETADLLRTTEHVDRNLREARRLRWLKDALICANTRSWMDGQICDSEDALREVQQLVEPARVDTLITESINAKNRVLWVLRDGPKVRHKRDRLQICNQTLNTVIGRLLAIEPVIVTPLPLPNGPQSPPPYSNEMESMFNWRRQRRGSDCSTRSVADKSIFSSSSSSSFSPVPDSSLVSPPRNQASRQTSSTENRMMATAVPSSFVSMYEEFDGLQLVSDIDQSHAVRGRQSRASTSAVCELPDEAVSVPISQVQFQAEGSIVRPSATERYQIRSASPISDTSGLETALSSPRRSKGRAWLESYATRSDTEYSGSGHSYQD